MSSAVDLEERVPKGHPLRTIKGVADEALERLSGEFDRMYSEVGRTSVPPERLLKASLLISLCSMRSERAFCEELEYNLLFRWFLDMNLMERSLDPTVFTKNRRRLLEHRTAQALFDEVVWEAARRGLLSDERFTVDGTLIEAQASIKSFRRREDQEGPPDDDSGNPSVDFPWGEVEERDPSEQNGPGGAFDAQGQGKEAKLSFMGYALMENGNGLLTDFVVGTAERDAVPLMLDDARQRGFHPKTLGGDKGYDTRGGCQGYAQSCSDASCGSVPTLCDRRSHHTASGLQDEPEDSQAGGGDIRVDEDCGRISADPVSGSGAHRAGRILRGHGLQPGADGYPPVATGGPGRSVGVTRRGAARPEWPDGAAEPPQTTS